VKIPLCLNISGMRGRCCIKPAQVVLPSVFCNSRPVPALLEIYPQQTDKRSGVCGFAILMILGMTYAAQICNAIVHSVSIDMVDFPVRPDAVNIRPRKSMSFVFHAIDLNTDVSPAVLASGNLPFFYPWASVYLVPKYARFRLVREPTC
jgi:hypothetical protein